MNFNHLPGGRPEGGQFTFANVGGYVMPRFASPQGGEAIKAEHIAMPAESLPHPALVAMSNELKRAGISDVDFQEKLLSRYPNVFSDLDELGNRVNELTRDAYFNEVVGGRIGDSLQTAIDRHQEEVVNGGQLKALASDDGAYHIIHTTNNSVSVWLDSITDMRNGTAAVYNPKTGVIRTDARVVPIPGTARRIGANSTNAAKRNRLNAVATNSQNNAKRASKELNKRITSTTMASGRQIGSNDYAGRIGVCVCKDDEGNLVVQNCIICNSNEGDIAGMYADELNAHVLKATRPAGAINAEPGDTSIFHEGGMYVGKSDFGGVAAGVMADKGRRNQVSPEAADRMHDLHRAMQQQRDEEYSKTHGGKPRPEKSEEKREHERLLRKRRAMRRKMAEASIGTDKEAIRLKGGGYIFPGETITRKGRTLSYDDIKNGALFQAPAEESAGVGRRAAAETGKKAAGEAVEKAKRRQTIKEGNKNRKQQQRAREAAIKEANAQGKRAVTFREGKDKRTGRTILLIEGEPGFEEALKYGTAKAYDPKK